MKQASKQASNVLRPTCARLTQQDEEAGPSGRGAGGRLPRPQVVLAADGRVRRRAVFGGEGSVPLEGPGGGGGGGGEGGYGYSSDEGEEGGSEGEDGGDGEQYQQYLRLGGGFGSGGGTGSDGEEGGSQEEEDDDDEGLGAAAR